MNYKLDLIVIYVGYDRNDLVCLFLVTSWYVRSLGHVEHGSFCAEHA
jgi:hypothetical protein